MNIVHMNEGEKIAHALDECMLTLGDDSAVIDLDEAQRDTEQVLTFRVGADGVLREDGSAYAAVLIIPPRRYASEEVSEEVDGETETYTARVPLPCEPAAATLQLWALPRQPDDTPEIEE